MRRASALRAAALLAALACAGCQDPYASDHTAPRRPQTVAASTDTEQPGEAARPLPPGASHGSRPVSAHAAASRFATRWVNWDWQTATRQQRALAQLAAGDLARQLLANAGSARIDATLARDRPGSRGRVAAIQLGTAAGRATGIVVTHEQSLTDGRAALGGQRYRVYTIRLLRAHGRWEVSAWTPQP